MVLAVEDLFRTVPVGTARLFAHVPESSVREHLDVMTGSDIKSLENAGWTMGAHAVKHARVSELDGVVLRHELTKPLETLQGRQGQDVTLACPVGLPADVWPEAVSLAAELGSGAALMDCGDDASKASHRFQLPPIEPGRVHPRFFCEAQARGVHPRRSA